MGWAAAARTLSQEHGRTQSAAPIKKLPLLQRLHKMIRNSEVAVAQGHWQQAAARGAQEVSELDLLGIWRLIDAP